MLDLLRPGDSLFLPFFAFSAIDSNHEHSYSFLADRLPGPLPHPFLESGEQRGVIASLSVHK